jgi:hypothetical protein
LPHYFPTEVRRINSLTPDLFVNGSQVSHREWLLEKGGCKRGVLEHLARPLNSVMDDLSVIEGDLRCFVAREIGHWPKTSQLCI